MTGTSYTYGAFQTQRLNPERRISISVQVLKSVPQSFAIQPYIHPVSLFSLCGLFLKLPIPRVLRLPLVPGQG